MIPTDCYVPGTLAILHNIRISQGYALAFMLILLLGTFLMIPTDCYVPGTLAILHNIRISQGYALAFMLILLQVSQTRKHFYASITCIRVRRPWVSLDQILCNCAECVAFDSLKHAVCEVDAWTGYNNAVFWHDHSDWFFHCCLAVIFEILIYISAQLFRVSFCPFDTSDFAT